MLPSTRLLLFGRLARLGDASSFVPDSRWLRRVIGPGDRARVQLVVVPEELPPNSLRTHDAIETAQGEGAVYVIETDRVLPVDRRNTVASVCAGRPADARC